jgi:catechol 2,3-dioxygenase-like lactoylglutathione lyase family enzyme
MLSDKAAHATIAVKDMAKARDFYRETLGLNELNSMNDGVAMFESGSTKVVVYQSEFAGTNKATSATWGVGDALENIVKDLQSKSVRFEHYDMPGLDREGDIHTAGDFKAAWFKDPDGNILHINNSK